MKIRQILLAFVAIGFCGAVQAIPSFTETITDNYWGGTPAKRNSSGDYTSVPGYTDIIGPSAYQISQAMVKLDGTDLTVDIYTNYATNVGKDHTALGDLFLGSSWTPVGSPSYPTDNAENGTHWGWGLHVEGPSSTSGGIATLYQLATGNSSNQNPGVLLSQDVFGSHCSNCIFRIGQAVAVNTGTNSGNNKTAHEGKWMTGTDSVGSFVQFSIDLADTSLLSAIDPASGGTGTLALHWAMTCANDVIEGSDDLPRSQVPEPTALSLLGLGLGLMGFRFRRRGHGRV